MLLTSVAVVCRAKLDEEDVARRIEAFLDPTPRWTVVTATRNEVSSTTSRQLRLLRRIAAREEAAGIDPYLKQLRFADALVNAVYRWETDVTKWLINEYSPTGVIYKALQAAVRVGDLDFLRWIHKNYSRRAVWWRRALCNFPYDAVGGSIFTIVKWLHQHDAPVDPDNVKSLVRIAAIKGDLEMMEWVLEREERRNWRMEMILNEAANKGHTNVLQWAVERLGATLSQTQMDIAISNGRLDTARWLLSQGIQILRPNTISGATRNKHFTTLRWAIENLTMFMKELEPGVDAMLAELGQLGIIQLLHEFGVIFTTTVMNSAARGGQLDVVKWVHSHWNVGCTTAAMDGAAENNHLDVVKWLNTNRSEGCTTEAIDQAATNGHLEVVIWFHENRTEGCTVRAMDGASANGYLAVVTWLHEHFIEGCTTAAMDGASANGHLAVVTWLHEYFTEGCTTAAMDGAIKSGHLNILKFLHDNCNRGYSAEAVVDAVREGHINVVKWMHLTRGEEITEDAIAEAAKRGNVDILKWFLTHYPGRVLGPQVMSRAIWYSQLECAIEIYSDGRFTWGGLDRSQSVASDFFTREVALSCWMWRKFPENMTATLEHARDITPELRQEFEMIQDTIIPSWRRIDF